MANREYEKKNSKVEKKNPGKLTHYNSHTITNPPPRSLLYEAVDELPNEPNIYL